VLSPVFLSAERIKQCIVIVFGFSVVPLCRDRSSNADRLCVVSSHTALHTFVISNTTSVVLPDCIELRFTLERQMKMADNLTVCISAEAVVHRL
jgi:hypothetical protein